MSTTTTATTTTTAHIKGAAVADFIDWMSRTRGEAVVQTAWARLSPATRAVLGTEPGRLLPFRWSPAEAICALCDALTGHLGATGRDALAHEGTRAIIDHTFRGLYGTTFRLIVNPKRYIDRVQTVWGLFHDTGTIVGEVLGPREHRTRLSGWRGRHPFIVGLNQAFAHALYESMGCRGVRTATSNARDANGDLVDVIDIRWSDGPT